MARLVNESGVLNGEFEATAQNVGSIPFDKLILAINTVQQRMGITGTTVAEASDTIAGSWNTMGSAWTNVLTALASDNEGFLRDSLQAVGTSTEDFLRNVTEAIKRVIGNLSNSLPEISATFKSMMPFLFETLLPAVVEGGIVLIKGLAQAIIDNLPLIVDAAKKIALSILDGIGDLVPILKPVTDALAFLVENFDAVLAVVIPLTAAVVAYKAAMTIQALITGVSNAVAAWKLVTQGMTIAQIALNLAMSLNPIALVVGLVAGLVAGIIYLWHTNEDFRNALISAWEKIKETADKVWNGIVIFFTEDIPEAIDKMVAWFKELPQKIGETFNNALEKVKDWIDDTVDTIRTEVPKIIGNVVDFFKELPYKIGYEIGKIIGTITKWGADVISTVKTEVPKIIDNVVTFFKELPGNIYDTIIKVKDKVVEWGSNIISTAKTEVAKIIENIVTFFKELPGKIYDKIIEAKDKIVEWTANLIDIAKTEIPKFVESVVETIKELPGKFLEMGRNIIEGLVNGIQETIGGAIENIKDFFRGIVDGVKDTLGIHSPSTIFAEMGRNLLTGLWQGIQDMISNFQSNTRNFFTGIIDNVKGILDINNFISIGTNIVNGVWNGIQGMASTFSSNVSNFFGNIVNNAKSVLGIRSPSVVFKEIGNFTGQGFIEGINGMSNAIDNVMHDTFSGFEIDDISTNLNLNRNLTDNIGIGSQRASSSNAPIVFNFNNSFDVNSNLDIELISRKLAKQTTDSMRSLGVVSL